MYELIPKTYKEIILYILVPLFIVLMIFGFILVITGRKNGKKNTVLYDYRVNYWSSVVGIIFGAMVFAVSIGFSVLFIERMNQYALADQFSSLVLFLFIFPIIPFVFLLYFIIKFIKSIRLKIKIDNHEIDIEEKKKVN